MNFIFGNTAKKTRPYVMKVDEKTGKIYLERERSPFYCEFPYVLALVVTIAFALTSYGHYIKLRTDIECRIQATQTLQQRFFHLKNDNTLLERMVYQTPDLDEIYDVATTELGMIPVTKDHIKKYEQSNSEYVFQRDNISKSGF